MVIEGAYYKTRTRNVLTGNTEFFITPNGEAKEYAENGLIKCIGSIGVFVKNMPIRMEGEFKNNVFCVSKYQISTNTKESVDKMLTWINDSISAKQKEQIAILSNNDLLSFVKQKNAREKIIAKIMPKSFISEHKSGNLTENTIRRYNKACELADLICKKTSNLINQEQLVKDLIGYGVDIGKIEILCQKEITMDKIKKNPYNLLLKFDIPIQVADAIFYQNNDVNDYDIKRLKGYLYDSMCLMRDNGNTCLEIGILLKTINYRIKNCSPSNAGFCEITLSILNLCIIEMEEYFCYQNVDGKVYVYFTEMLLEEKDIVSNIMRLQYSKKETKIKASIDDIEKKLNITYNEEQRKAFDLLNTSGVKILTGPPGSGKTSVIKGFLEYYSKNGTVKLAATTGMAAKVMANSCGKSVQTVNQMLELSYFDKVSEEKNINNPINADLIIVDEVSMLGAKLCSALLKAIKSGSILLLVGDEDQLQSVEYGNILHDFIISNKIEIVRLEKILRQSGTICENAGLVNKGIKSIKTDNTFEVYNYTNNEEAIKCLIGCKKQENSIILTPSKIYSNYGTSYLNYLLQKKDNEILVSYGNLNFRVNDKVVMTRNNYDSNYINGDLGIIRGFDGNFLTIEFTNKTLNISQDNFQDIDLAYALTIHKSQGSEFNEVYILLQDKVKNMCTKRLLYTAITRAKEKITIFNVNGTMECAISNQSETKRTTNLFNFFAKLEDSL